MDIKQKLNDAKLLVKNDRRVWAGIGGLLFILVFAMMSGKSAKKGIPQVQQEQQRGASQMTDVDQAYKDLVKAIRGDLDQIGVKVETMSQKNDRLTKDFQAHKAEAEGLFQMFTDRLEGMQEDLRTLQTAKNEAPQQVADASGSNTAEPSIEEPVTVGSFGFEESTVPPPPPPAPPAPARSSFISTGDSVKIKLLTGVTAPVDGTPYPVVFKLDGPITGPDGSSLDLGEARLVAAAQGSETEGRVLYRLTDLAIRHKDGRRSVVKVDGWVVGEDGIRGHRGKVIDKLGQLIAATATASFAAALGERVDTQRNRLLIPSDRGAISVTGTDVDAATASALTDSSNRLGQLLVDKYERLVPVVEVRAGREAAAIFSKSAEVEILKDDDSGEGIYAASMD